MNTTYTYSGIFWFMLLGAGIATAQTIPGDAGVGATSYFGSGANSYGGTVEGSLTEGLAAMSAGAGQYNLNTALGARYLEDARSRYIDNYRAAVDLRYAVKRANDTYRAEKYGRERLTSEQVSHIIQAKLPDRLTAAEYNRRTGALNWPAVLMGPEFAADRHLVQIAFAQRHADDVGMSSDFYRNVSQHVQQMYDKMLSEIHSMSSADSIAARRFLKSVEFEARHLPEDSSLASNDDRSPGSR